MFQIISSAELAALQDGSGVEGSLGVVYQLRSTGEFYTWNPDTQTMDGFTADQGASVRALVSGAGLLARARTAWLNRVAVLKAENPIIGNTGFGGANTICFVNSEHTNNGDGTTPAAATGAGLAGAFNVIPTTALNTTYLLCEGTSHASVEIANHGVMLATYGRNSTASAIQRVTDPARVATIDGAGTTWGVRSVANKNSWGLSGIRVTNVAGAGCDAVQLGAQTSTVSSSDCFAEYVYVDNVAGTSGSVGAGIVSRGTQTIIRFCTVRIAEGEPIYCDSNGAGAPADNPQVYGNDVEISSLTADGPDGIQVLNQIASTASTSIRVEANWVNVSNQNCKYGIIVTHTPTPARTLIAHNVIQCSDVSAIPNIATGAGAGNQQGGIYCTVIPSVAQGVHIVGNVVVSGEACIDYAPASGGSVVVRGNLCYQPGTSRVTGYRPIGIYLRSNCNVASLVEHNTVAIDADSGTDSRGIFTAANAAVHQYNANLVVGPWKWGIQKGSATTESYNVAFGAVAASFANSAGASVAAGTGSSTADPGVLVGSFFPSTLAATVPATIRAYPVDPFGSPYRGRPGAVQ